jgi:hypothetical protein
MNSLYGETQQNEVHADTVAVIRTERQRWIGRGVWGG